MHLTRVSLIAATACVLAACGSTVAPTGQALPGSGTPQNGLSVQQAAGNGSAAAGQSAQVAQSGQSGQGDQGGLGATAAKVTGSGASSAGRGRATPGATGARTGTVGGQAARAQGPGISATTISLGIPYCSDCAQANAALGTAGGDTSDPRQYYRAVLDDINAHGGVLGRKLVPVFHDVSASDNFDTSSQEACEDFTKDHKVLVMFLRGGIAAQCAKKAGILNVGDLGSGPAYAQFPNVFAPSSIRLERLGASTVRGMVQQGWQRPEPTWPTGKIGLITWEAPDYEYAMKNGWLPAMHAAGLKESDVRYVAVPQSDKSLADASAAVSSAVLSFRDKGIDHVFISDGPSGIFAGTGLTFLFLNTAKSQKYFPRYGFNGNNSPGWSALPADQQSGMLATDAFDLSPEADAGIALNPARERCANLMKKKGYTKAGLSAVAACEYGWFTQAILMRAAGTTLPDMIAAAEGLGTTYRSPFSFGNRLNQGQHDGGALFRNSRFDDACACMKYTSKPYEP